MGLEIARFLPDDAQMTTIFAGQTPMARQDRNSGPFLCTFGGQTRYAWFVDKMRRAWNNSGLVVNINALTDGAGDITWGAAFERHQVGVTDLSLTTNFAAEVTAIMASASGGFMRNVSFNMTFSEIGGILIGESYRLRLKCIANGSNVLFAGAQLSNLT